LIITGTRARAALAAGARSDDFFKGERGAEFFSQRAQFALRAAGRDDPVERFEQAIGCDRFLDEITRSGAHRANRDLDPVAHGDDDER